MSARPYAEAVVDYARAGWPCVLPVPPATKTPPPVGFTGAEGKDTDALQLAAWAGGEFGAYSIALRMPLSVVGIDVDQYAKGEVQKHGAETLAACLERWGPLPATWSSTARGGTEGPKSGTDGHESGTSGPGASRIMFFRVPEQRYVTKLDATHPDGRHTSDIEIIQRHHRYAVVAPSPHGGVEGDPGAVYRWYDPTGALAERVPSPAELPDLPETWVAGLLAGATQAGLSSAGYAEGDALLTELLADHRPECADVTSVRLNAMDELSGADAGSRHDTMTGRVHHLVQIGAAGHAGVGGALAALRELWAELTAGEGREDELQRMMLTSARKAVTAVGEHQVPRDPCLLVQGYAVPGPVPGDDRPLSLEHGGTGPGAPGGDGEPYDVQGIEPARWWSSAEIIGTQSFDPNADLDQSLAERVLERISPGVRYAYDTGSWLLRMPEKWEQRNNLAEWAVAQCASLMPLGDPTAEKDSDAYGRAKRRTRLQTQGGAAAVGKKMAALVSGGMHPASLALADLDADPEVLWAGGAPWSLRASGEVPTLTAGLDPNTPHLHAAGCTPQPIPTPLWDAFTAAVWPDPALRAWALRVLAIGLTGYADRALPILLGETGRGKTQLVHLVMSLLGSYAHAADPRLMSAAGEHAHASIIYALKGRRFSFIDEGPREGHLAQERLKQLTGGGQLTANEMNRNPITFDPSHTLVLTTNDEPPLTDPAVRSRARLIPCEGDPEQVRATRAAIGHLHHPTWRREAPGVLAALMREAAAVLADPSTASITAAPETVRYLAENLGAEQDPVLVWLREETVPSDAGTASRELYQAFTASCVRNNLRRDTIPSEAKWGRTLTRLGYGSIKTMAGMRRALQVRGGGFLPGMPGPAPTTVSTPVTTPQPPAPAPSPAPSPGPSAHTPTPGPSTPDGETSPGYAQGAGSPVDNHGAETADSCRVDAGLMQGSEPNPAYEFPQVNLRESENHAGYAGFDPFLYTHAGAPAQAHTREADPRETLQPCMKTAKHGTSPAETSMQGSDSNPAYGGSTLHDHAPDQDVSAGQPPSKPARKPTDPAKAAAAAEKRAATKAAKRAEAMAAAAGELLDLPALVLSTGEVRTVSPADADALLSTITGPTGTGTLTVDVEHTGYPIGHQHYQLRTVQLGDHRLALVLDPGVPVQAEVIREHMAAARTLHAHSATADLVPLDVAGLAEPDGPAGTWARMVDTGILAKLADPASTGNSPDLKGLARNVLGARACSPEADAARSALFKAAGWLTEVEVTTDPSRSGWAQVDPRCATMIRYAGSDVLDGAALALALPQPDPAVLERERAAQRMTARVTHRGIRLDPEQVDRLLTEHRTGRDEQGAKVRGYGIDNPGSNPQIGQAMLALGAALPRTPAGKPSVAKAVLEPMAKLEGPGTDLAREVLAYRHHATALSLLLEPYGELVRRGDGRARPTIYTLGADTGRMSSARPNVQQVSREGGMRACFTADPGYLLASADFAGVELRVAAALSGDADLAEIMADPERDLHWEVARLAFGPGATKAQRYAIKRGVFGRIYGGGVGAVADGVGVSRPVAQQVIDAMDALTPTLSEWSRMVRTGVESGRTKFLTYTGRVIHLPTEAPHAAPNYCIQGTAREALVDAMLRWQDTRWGDATLFPVHDEIVVQVPEADGAEATAALVECMATEINGVPLVAEASEPSRIWEDSV